jgi:hypothetical protein
MSTTSTSALITNWTSNVRTWRILILLGTWNGSRTSLLSTCATLEGLPAFRCKVRRSLVSRTALFVPDRVLDIPHLPIDDLMDDLNQDEDTIDPDDRRNQRLLDSRVQADGELSDSDDEGEGGRKNQHSHKDDDELVPARKFVTTTGIMNPGASAASHGAGPSAHPPTSIPTALVTADEMDVDDVPAEEPLTEEPKLADTTEKEDQPQPATESTAGGEIGADTCTPSRRPTCPGQTNGGCRSGHRPCYLKPPPLPHSFLCISS